MRCPRCGGNDVRLFVALNPGVVLECPGCGEVWREGEDLKMDRFRALYGLAAGRTRRGDSSQNRPGREVSPDE